MVRVAALTFLAFLVLPTWADDKEDAKKELEKLQGEWKLVHGEAGGQAFPKESIQSYKMTFKDNGYVFVSGEETESGTITLNPKTSPPQIDVDIKEGSAKGQKQLGIYELKGDRVKFCVAKPGDMKRPTKMATTAEDMSMIFEFEKVKK